MESSWSSRPSLRVNWLTIRDKGNKRRVKPIDNNNKNGNSSSRYEESEDVKCATLFLML